MVSGFAEAKEVLHSDDFTPALYGVVGPDVPRANDIFLHDATTHARCRLALARGLSRDRVAEISSRMLQPIAERLRMLLPRDAPVEIESAFVAPYYRECIYRAIGVSDPDGDDIVAILVTAHRYFDREGRDSVRGYAALKLLNERAAEVCNSALPGSRIGQGLIGFLKSEDVRTTVTTDEIVSLILSFFDTLGLRVPVDLTATLLRFLGRLTRYEQERLRSDPRRMLAAASEAARLQRRGTIPRTAKQDSQLGGHLIKAGDPLLILIGEADRDERVFASPDTFDPWRANVDDHLGFGAGRHGCIGKRLGKAIAATGALALLENFELETLTSEPPGLQMLLHPRTNKPDSAAPLGAFRQ